MDNSAGGTRQDAGVPVAVGRNTRHQIVIGLSVLSYKLSDVLYCGCVPPIYFVW